MWVDTNNHEMIWTDLPSAKRLRVPTHGIGEKCSNTFTIVSESVEPAGLTYNQSQRDKHKARSAEKQQLYQAAYAVLALVV